MRTRRLGVGAALVDGHLHEGDVAVAGDRIAEVGLLPAGRGLAAPGLVDLQVNGFAGVDLLTDDDDAWMAASRRLLDLGVTAYQPTLITASRGALLDGLRRAARLMRAQSQAAGAELGARIIGVHLEGPFLSPERLGTHPAEHLRDPDGALVDELRAAGPVSMMTIAPERPGALALIETLVRSGIVVSLGHSAADARTVRAAVGHGARAVTHVFNAMEPIRAREPGLAGVALVDDRLTVMCIVDDVHLAPETVGILARCAGDRTVLVSDAIAGAACEERRVRLGELDVSVTEDGARGADGTIAGGVSTLPQGVARLVDHGWPVQRAVAAATIRPARLIDRAELGALTPGAIADVTILDDDLRVVEVLLGGSVVAEGS